MQNIRRNQAVFQRNRQNTKKKQFEKFQATELYCPICRKAMPVRERLLLVLPEGEKFEDPRVRCGESLGDKIVKGETKPLVII